MPELLILGEYADKENAADPYLLCSGDQPSVGTTVTLLEPTNPLEWKVSKVVPRPDGTFVLQLTGHRIVPHPQWRLTIDVA